jgi:hypothetical protein
MNGPFPPVSAASAVSSAAGPDGLALATEDALVCDRPALLTVVHPAMPSSAKQANAVETRNGTRDAPLRGPACFIDTPP